ncbi:unnamed protein product, partial [Didymodactylos carnosus]
NSTLREDDRSKVDTLEAYCYMLNEHLYTQCDDMCLTTLYRDVTLTDEMMDEYRQAVGTFIKWLAFTLTLKNREVAEMFCYNTSFIIEFDTRFSMSSDISLLSHHPNEEEVLLTAGHGFYVDKVEDHASNGEYLIYLAGC